MTKNVPQNENEKKDKCQCECKKPLKLHICKGNYIYIARTDAYEYLHNYTRH